MYECKVSLTIKNNLFGNNWQIFATDVKDWYSPLMSKK